MLEHSRAGDGSKEPTDINAIADEYIRLAYHGIRAKDKSLPAGSSAEGWQAGFNADFKTDLDPNLPKIKVVGQDIARVVLNLISNAFYAVSARAKSSMDSDYKPTVEIITKKLDDKVQIRIKDNGAGIPEEIKDKIFQPFFTTKASGEGTGLGLSLSYDIITKGHGGELSVKTMEGEGTEFIITIPIQTKL
jgi:signal transduction histidine kinase